MKRIRKLLVITLMTLISVFLLIFAAACGESLHDCAYENLGAPTKLYQPTAVGSSSPHQIVAEMSNWKQDRPDDAPLVKNYYLSSSYTLESNQQITLGKNVHIAICVNSASLIYSESQIVLSQDENGVANSSFFVYDCGERHHGCYAAMEVALNLTDNYLSYGYQYARSCGLESFALPSGYYCVDSSLSLSAYIASGKVSFNSPANTTICFNNEATATDEEVIALRRLGFIVHTECTEEEKIVEHDCIYSAGLELETIALNQDAFEVLVENIQNATASLAEVGDENVGQTPVFVAAYLTGDIVSNVTLSIPDDMYIGICTNGFNFDAPTEGSVYIYDCTPHVCVCMSCAEMVPLWQAGWDFYMAAAAQANMPQLLPDGEYALMEDLDGAALLNGLNPAGTYALCTNGYTLTGAELPQASDDFVVFDCTTLAQEGVYSHVCSEIRGHITPIYVTEEVLSFIAGTGVLTLPGGASEIALALPMDLETDGMLIIPKGMKLYVCLNGYKLSATEALVRNATTPSIFKVEFGAELHICDCSKNKTGALVAGTIEMMGSDTSDLSTATPIYNLGKTVLDTVTLQGVVGIINGGRLIAIDSKIEGLLVGSFIAEANASDYPLHSKKYSVEMDGCEISGGFAGLLSDGGNTILRDSEVKGSIFGVMLGLDVLDMGEGAKGGLTLDNVSVELTMVIPEGEVLLTGLIQELGVVSAIATNSVITVEGDLIINVDEHLLAPYIDADYGVVKQAMLAEILLSNSAYFDVADGVTLTDDYRIMIDGEISEDFVLANKDLSENFIMMEGLVSMVNNNGEFIVVASENMAIFETATVTRAEVSFDGYVRLDFYCTFNAVGKHASLLDKAEANVIFNVADEKRALHPSTMQLAADNEFIYSVPFYAKDYTEKIYVQFTDGKYTWTGISPISVKDFLETSLLEVQMYLESIQSTLDNANSTQEQIEEAETVKEEMNAVKNSILAMLNYCGVTSKYFYGVEYQELATPFSYKEVQTRVDEETQETVVTETWMDVTIADIMNAVTAETLEGYTPSVLEGSVLPTGVQFLGTSLILNSGVFIRFYFSATPEAMQTLTVKCGETTLTPKLYNASQNTYYVEVENLSALQLKTMYELTLTDGENEFTVSYGVFSYMYGVLNNPNADEALVNVAKATFIYALTIEDAMRVLSGNVNSEEV